MKKLLAFALMFAFVCSLSLSSVGCSKKDEKKDSTPAADADKKKPAAP